MAKIQTEMTDAEQQMVDMLCKQNLLDDEHWLIKDGSLEYSPNTTNLDKFRWESLKDNYRHVVGVSKMFDPELLPDNKGNRLSLTIANLKPFERTAVYRYTATFKDGGHSDFAVWYLRIRNPRPADFRESRFCDVVKCEMVITSEDQLFDSDLINTISANIIREAYPVCYGSDTRWANHLYPVFLTETFCKSHYINDNIILNLF